MFSHPTPPWVIASLALSGAPMASEACPLLGWFAAALPPQIELYPHQTPDILDSHQFFDEGRVVDWQEMQL